MSNTNFRTETDSMGPVKIPADALWGAQTQRALENFPVSGIRFPRRFIRALGMVKMAAAEVNTALNLLPEETGAAIARAAREVMEGTLDDQFPLDIFQTGSGTSTNMNANEVVANRACELRGTQKGDRNAVHPNDHVNRGQSSNDVIPACIHIAAVEAITSELLPALRGLAGALDAKAREFDSIVKIGRTHLQDATPIRLGQEFGGYARMTVNAAARIEGVLPRLSELALGGTAVGTGINTHPEFAPRVIEKINRLTGLSFREAPDHFEAQGSRDAVVEASAALKCAAVALFKTANDIRLLGCGPRCGIGEIMLPEVQPGSSIMPGKVNPVMAESLIQAAAQVIGNDAAIALGGLSGNFELNVMMPVMAHNLFQSIGILSASVTLFTDKCVRGIQADKKRCAELLEKSLALVTALTPVIGYDKAASVAKDAWKQGKTIREIVLEQGLVPAEELDGLLDPRRMV